MRADQTIKVSGRGRQDGEGGIELVSLEVEWQNSFPITVLENVAFLKRLRIAALILFRRVLDLQAVTVGWSGKMVDEDEDKPQAQA